MSNLRRKDDLSHLTKNVSIDDVINNDPFSDRFVSRVDDLDDNLKKYDRNNMIESIHNRKKRWNQYKKKLRTINIFKEKNKNREYITAEN